MENTIKKIKQVTNFWLFKKTNETTNHFFVRSQSENTGRINWFIGQETSYGSVTSVAGSLSDSVVENLENEFKVEMRNNNIKEVTG